MVSSHSLGLIGLLCLMGGMYFDLSILRWSAAVALSFYFMYQALKVAVKKDLTLAKDHWSRNPQACKPKYCKDSFPLECDWQYECCKTTSEDVRRVFAELFCYCV